MARAGAGVCYGFFARAQDAAGWLAGAAARGWKAVIEWSPEPWKRSTELWPAPGADLEIMLRVKRLWRCSRTGCQPTCWHACTT